MTSPQDLARLNGALHRHLAEDAKVPGVVWCRSCRRRREVDPADCLARGWPKCCGATMTIDPPETW